MTFNKKSVALQLSTIGIAIFAIHVKPATAAMFALDIEPIVGYERNQKLVPTAHTKERIVYGARAAVGIPLLKLEAEFTRGSDNEVFTEPAMTTKDTDDKLKVGAKSTLRMGRIFSLILRAGGQAKQNTHEETRNGVTTKVINPIVYKPYGGFGLSAGLGSKLQLTGGLTVVFNKFPDMNQNDYQTTLGFTVKLP